MPIAQRLCAGALSVSLLATFSSALPASAAGYAPYRTSRAAAPLYQFKLPNGDTAMVYPDGIAHVMSKDRRKAETEVVMPAPRYDDAGGPMTLPDKGHIMEQLMAPPPSAYASGRVIVVYRTGTFGMQPVVSVDRRALRASVPAYTNDAILNRALASIGVDRSEHLFRQFDRSMLTGMRQQAVTDGRSLLDFANAYRLHVSAMSVRNAVAALSKLPEVAYVSPDWHVSTLNAPAIPVRPGDAEAARRRAYHIASDAFAADKPSGLPTNYALTASAQSLLNAPSVDAAGAFDEIDTRYHQLPGQGELITNVSLGDLDDASAATNTKDPCYNYAYFYGGTTIVQNGQRYLDMPSMPLIPAFTADASGNLDGTGEVCGQDSYLTEVGLDFSMMSPLPHNLQRPGEIGTGQTDLLGIAPGAKYRLVVPSETSPTTSDIDAALLAAALQNPRPNVITASLGFGFDSAGFPSRYLEEDPLTEAIVQAIVQSYHIVVCIAANDGTRETTPVAIGPAGGSAATDLLTPGGTPTSLSDDTYSTIPSRVFDSGSIDVGGVTLDDIFADPPQYATSPSAIAQHAYADTRWTGFTSFSSGFGSRVNVSAPGDNVLSFEHTYGGAPDAVTVVLEGGTSASAPETAAAAAVALQVSRLTGHPLDDPSSVRKLLEQTGSAVPNVPQADQTLAVGRQINLRALVESLLAKAPGPAASPRVARVAIEQRRDAADLNGGFESDTDPTDIDLANGTRPGSDQLSWITIAPDWEYVPANATYALRVAGKAKTLATTPWARLLPATIFAAAGIAIPSSSNKTVKMTYAATVGNKRVATTTFSLTFGPSVSSAYFALAPQVPAVVTGAKIAVTYDLTQVSDQNSPRLIVSEPGRVDPDTGLIFHPIVSQPLMQQKGTIQIPVSQLQGGGIYGVGIEIDSVNGIYSNFAFTRVAATTSENRPQAPLLSSNGAAGGHYLEIPYGGSFKIGYDVSSVPKADGALLEISAAGPTAFNIWNPFNNPNGTIKDDNGLDTGSVYTAKLSGKSGTVTIPNAATAGLLPTLDHVVRVTPLDGSTPVGEGSDVSSVTMDGVMAADGGYVNNGWGIDASGSDGFITSGQELASGEDLTSLEVFNQTNNQITQTIGSSANQLYYTNDWGIYGNDVGLACNEQMPSETASCTLLNPVATGTLGSSWTPSLSDQFSYYDSAANSTSDVAAFYGYDDSTSQLAVFSSNLLTSATTPIVGLGSVMSTFAAPVVWGIGQNTTTNTAVLPADDAANSSAPPTILLVNLNTNQATSFAGLGSGFPYGIGVDSTSDKAAVPTLTDCGLTIYNLATQTGNEVILPQPPSGNANGVFTMADPKASLFLISQAASPDFNVNNNTLSEVLVYDEQGNLKESVERFYMFDTFLSITANFLQVNPTTRSGYLIGPYQQQLAPFNY
jgi:hypothetical protein